MGKIKAIKKKKAPHRPLKYGEPTEQVPIRMPVSKKAEIKQHLKEFMKQYIKTDE